MKFKDKFHKESYLAILDLMGNDDVYRKTFAYLISLDIVCRHHFVDLYDFDEFCLKENPLNHAWQTGTSRKTTALAYNLYTDSTLWYDEDTSLFGSRSYICSVSDIMCCEYAPYYFEAIKIRYPEYFQGNDF